MQDILTCVMGLDVHRDIIVACLVRGAVDAEPEAETRTFSTLIPEMQKLQDWVIEAECRNIAMESTGIYWQPIYEMLGYTDLLRTALRKTNSSGSPPYALSVQSLSDKSA